MQHGILNADSPHIKRLLQNEQAGWANMPGFPGSVLVQWSTGCLLLTSERKRITRPLKEVFPKKNRYDQKRFRAHIDKFEDLTTYMYLDRKGVVTVGLGHRIPNVDAVKAITFLHRGKTTIADNAQKMRNYNLVLNSGRTGDAATEFKSLTNIDLDLTANESLFNNDVAEFQRLLRHPIYFPDFETYPAGAQLGMLVIAYTMGVAGFFKDYTDFREALKYRNWLTVADESGRKVISDIHGNPGTMEERNTVVKGWFLEAIRDEPFFLNPDCPPKQLFVGAG